MDLDQGARLRLRQAALFGPTRDVRARAAVLLLIGDGQPLAAVARLAGVSRPTVYQWCRVWQAYGRPDALDRRGITRRAAIAAELRKKPRIGGRSDPG